MLEEVHEIIRTSIATRLDVTEKYTSSNLTTSSEIEGSLEGIPVNTTILISQLQTGQASRSLLSNIVNMCKKDSSFAMEFFMKGGISSLCYLLASLSSETADPELISRIFSCLTAIVESLTEGEKQFFPLSFIADIGIHVFSKNFTVSEQAIILLNSLATRFPNFFKENVAILYSNLVYPDTVASQENLSTISMLLNDTTIPEQKLRILQMLFNMYFSYGEHSEKYKGFKNSFYKLKFRKQISILLGAPNSKPILKQYCLAKLKCWQNEITEPIDIMKKENRVMLRQLWTDIFQTPAPTDILKAPNWSLLGEMEGGVESLGSLPLKCLASVIAHKTEAVFRPGQSQIPLLRGIVLWWSSGLGFSLFLACRVISNLIINSIREFLNSPSSMFYPIMLFSNRFDDCEVFISIFEILLSKFSKNWGDMNGFIFTIMESLKNDMKIALNAGFLSLSEFLNTLSSSKEVQVEDDQRATPKPRTYVGLISRKNVKSYLKSLKQGPEVSVSFLGSTSCAPQRLTIAPRSIISLENTRNILYVEDGSFYELVQGSPSKRIITQGDVTNSLAILEEAADLPSQWVSESQSSSVTTVLSISRDYLLFTFNTNPQLAFSFYYNLAKGLSWALSNGKEKKIHFRIIIILLKR